MNVRKRGFIHRRRRDILLHAGSQLELGAGAGYAHYNRTRKTGRFADAPEKCAAGLAAASKPFSSNNGGARGRNLLPPASQRGCRRAPALIQGKGETERQPRLPATLSPPLPDGPTGRPGGDAAAATGFGRKDRRNDQSISFLHLLLLLTYVLRRQHDDS